MIKFINNFCLNLIIKHSDYTNCKQKKWNENCYFCLNRFISENERKVDLNQTCYYPTFASNRWLSVRLESIGNLIILVINK
jgi:hypothetical protein